MSPDNNTLIALGLIIKPRGLSGEMLVRPYNENSTSIRSGLPVVLRSKTINHPGIIQYAKRHSGRLIIKIEGIGDRDEAEDFRNCDIYCELNKLSEKKSDEYYVFDLVGLNVIDDAGEIFGKLIEVMSLPANDALVIEHEGVQVLVPFLYDYIDSVNIDKKQIVIGKVREFLL